MHAAAGQLAPSVECPVCGCACAETPPCPSCGWSEPRSALPPAHGRTLDVIELLCESGWTFPPGLDDEIRDLPSLIERYPHRRRAILRADRIVDAFDRLAKLKSRHGVTHEPFSAPKGKKTYSTTCSSCSVTEHEQRDAWRETFTGDKGERTEWLSDDDYRSLQSDRGKRSGIVRKRQQLAKVKKIAHLFVAGCSGREVSRRSGIPLATVQRLRTVWEETRQYEDAHRVLEYTRQRKLLTLAITDSRIGSSSGDGPTLGGRQHDEVHTHVPARSSAIRHRASPGTPVDVPLALRGEDGHGHHPPAQRRHRLRQPRGRTQLAGSQQGRQEVAMVNIGDSAVVEAPTNPHQTVVRQWRVTYDEHAALVKEVEDGDGSMFYIVFCNGSYKFCDNEDEALFSARVRVELGNSVR